MKSRLLLIGMIALLMFGAVFIFGTTLYEEGQVAETSSVATDLVPSLPVERGVFSRSGDALTYKNMPESEKELKTYYKNRAYPGAPPMIPHPLISEKGIGGKTCLQCHQNGGYAEQFKAFSPITPHPEMLNCKQCHLPKKTELTFKATNWEKINHPEIQQSALVGSPPIIPHELDMRSNCLSCHAGAGAPKEIRVSHPERVNCRQCHVPKNTKDIFKKPVSEGAVFQRPNKMIGSSEPALKESEVSEISNWVKNKKHN